MSMYAKKMKKENKTLEQIIEIRNRHNMQMIMLGKPKTHKMYEYMIRKTLFNPPLAASSYLYF